VGKFIGNDGLIYIHFHIGGIKEEGWYPIMKNDITVISGVEYYTTQKIEKVNDKEIKVTVHIPVSPRNKEQTVNNIYDILKPMSA